ncbi:MAG TPA: TOBE domain-containing protein [Micromonosporaceae bacterium]|nr:TOBE domain-containing protein [Micromonosporaceae bacterium]
MRLSIRNQLGGTVQSVSRGEVMGIVRVRLDGGQELTSAITLEAVDELGLVDGKHVTVLVKSTDVAIASDGVGGLSVRNLVPGTVERVDHGAVMTTVKVAIAGGQSIVSAITKDGAEDLNLVAGDRVTALVKSTEVSIAVD